jgi:hypothetical protein
MIRISLPGFGIESTTKQETCDVRTSAVDSGAGNFISRGTWNLTSQTLYLVADKKIERSQLLEVAVPNSFGLRLPFNGLELNHATLRIGGDFEAGDVLMTRIWSSERVPVLEDAQFRIDPARVAEDVALNFSFTHVARLRTLAPGETLSIFLPGFTSLSTGELEVYSSIRESGRSPLEFDEIIASPRVFTSAHWDVSSETLILTVGIPILSQDCSNCSHNEVQILVPKSERFRLSSSGFASDTATFLLDQRIGPSLPSRIRNGAIGFLGAEARVSLITVKEAPLRAGEVSTIQIEFEPAMDIAGGESIILRLPGFQRLQNIMNVKSSEVVVYLNGSAVTDSVGAFNPVFSWLPGELRMGIPSDGRVQKFTSVRLYVKHTAGIMLPVLGVRMGMQNHGITIQSDASAGIVLPTRIPCEPPVGSFKQTSVTFGNDAEPGRNVDVNLMMIPYMRLEAGDTVRVHLPDFSGPLFIPNPDEKRPGFAVSLFNFVEVGGSFGSKVTVFWESAGEQVVLRFLEAVDEAELVNILIPSQAGLKPGAGSGLKRDDPVYIQTAAGAGPVLDTRFEIVQEVGRFPTFSIDFLPSSDMWSQQPAERRPGKIGSLEITLEYGWEIFKGDSIYIVLPNSSGIHPGFQRVGGESVVLSRAKDIADTATLSDLEAAHQFSARWIKMYNELELVCERCRQYEYGCICGSPKSGGEPSVFTIRDGFKLPEFLDQSNSGIQIYAIDSRDMMMNFHQPIGFSPRIGLVESEMLFEPTRPGEASTITILFSLTMSMLEDDIIEISMPRFVAENGPLLLSGAPITAMWLNSTLILKVTNKILADTKVKISVPENTMSCIKLPVRGIPMGAAGITMSIDGQTGTFRRPFEVVQAVGGFENSSITVHVNSTRGVQCSFRYATLLSSGQQIEVSLMQLQLTEIMPGMSFSSDPAELLASATIRRDYTTDGNATFNSTFLVMDLFQSIPAQTTFSIHISGISSYYVGDVDSLHPMVSLVGETKPFSFMTQRILALDLDASLRASSLSAIAQDKNPSLVARKLQSDGGGPRTDDGGPRSQVGETAYDGGAESEESRIGMSLERARLSAAQGRSFTEANIARGARFLDLSRGSSNAFEQDIFVNGPRRRQGLECPTLTANSTLKYFSPLAAEVVSFEITFTCLIPRVSQFKLRLPQISRSAGGLDLGLRYVGSWKDDSVLEIIDLDSDAHECDGRPCAHSIFIPAAAGFILRNEGVVANDPLIRFEFRHTIELLCSEPVGASEAVGSFFDSSGTSSGPSVQFCPGVPGEINEVLLQLRSQVSIAPGEKITLKLPGFSGYTIRNILIEKGSCEGDPIKFSGGFGCDFAGTPGDLVGLATGSGFENASGLGSEGEGSMSGSDVEDYNFFASAAWSNVTQLLELTVLRNILQFQLCSLTVPSTANVRLPERGVLPNYESNIEISCDAATGNILSTRVPKVRGVGSLFGHSLQYIPSTVVRETQIRVRFTPSMPMFPGDKLVVRLPYFTGESSSCVRIAFRQSEPRGSIALVDWNLQLQELSLYITGNIERFANVNVLIPASAGLILPIQGVKLNQNTLTMEAQALYGNVPATPISISDAVGSFLSSPTLSYEPGIAGVPSAIKFSFKPEMDILSGESVFLALSGFTGPEQKFSFSSVPENMFDEAFVTDKKGFGCEIQFPVSSTIPAGSNVRIEIPMALNITIPQIGLKLNQETLKIFTNASGGPVPAPGLAISNSEPVGAFFDPSTQSQAYPSLPRISFQFDDVNGPAKIRFEFIAMMTIVEGESLNLKLSLFSAGSDIDSVLLAKGADRFDASWRESTQELKLQLLSSVPACPEAKALRNECPILSVEISSSAGIRLPPHGVTKNDEDLKVNCSSTAGPVVWIPIKYSQAVGIFERKEVRFEPQMAGALANLLLNYRLNRPISRGAEVVVNLVGKQSPECDSDDCDECEPFHISAGYYNTSGASTSAFPQVQIVNCSIYGDGVKIRNCPVLQTMEAAHPGYTFSAWLQRSDMLILKFVAAVEVDAGSNVSLEVSNVRLPTCGVPTDYAIALSTTAAAGPVQPASLATMGIGAFRETSVEYELPKINTISAMSVSFKASMNFNENEKVTLYLPGFTGSSRKHFRVLSTASDGVENKCCPSQLGCFSTATWDNVTSLLDLHITQKSTQFGSRFCVFKIHVPALIRLPIDGVVENDQRLTISTTAYEGQVDPIAIQSSTGVYSIGSLVVSSLNFTLEMSGCSGGQYSTGVGSNPSAGKPAVLRISLQAMMVFSLGDTISLNLPGFLGKKLTSTSGCQGCIICQATWNETSSTLVLTFARKARARHVVEFETEPDLLLLPEDGVRRDQASIMISSNAAAGPFRDANFKFVQPIGSFRNYNYS